MGEGRGKNEHREKRWLTAIVLERDKAWTRAVIKDKKYTDSKSDRIGIWLDLKGKSQVFGLGN